MFTFAILAALSLANPAEARVFFKRSGAIGITYSNIFTGTVQLASTVPFEFRYSDDDAACVVLYGGKQYDCKSDRGSSTSETIYMSNPATGLFLASMLNSVNQSSYIGILNRILSVGNYARETFTMNYSSAAGVKQLHDPEPESFHIYYSKFGEEIPLGSVLGIDLEYNLGRDL
jgi:hypothetical protein